MEFTTKLVVLEMMNAVEVLEYDRLCQNVWQAEDEYAEVCKMIDQGLVVSAQQHDSERIMLNQKQMLARFKQEMYVKYMPVPANDVGWVDLNS